MDLMGLIIGVCLPLLAGFAFLNLVGPTDSRPSRFLRRTGYGYFLGCVLLYVLLKTISLLSGELRPVWVALALSVVTVVAAWLGRHKFRYSAASLDRTLTSSQRMLIATLLAWMAIHLFFSAVEVGVNPVYPWDAWTVWVYRAKAWFFNDQLFDFMTFGQWLQAATAESYTTPALKYPWLPSIMPLWAALCLGNWHEALVGVPVVVAGLALTASFYGQLRAIDLPPLPAVVFTAFLASTPLWGVHLSLAGYADIWMAGFAGLGFIALLRALSENDSWQFKLGLALLATGVLVKLEGLVWLLTGLLLIAVCRMPLRWLLGMAIGFILVLCIALVSGLTWLDIPGIGLIGVHDGSLVIPLLGTFEIELHDVRSAYWHNAFTMGNWHLAWGLAIVAVAYAVFRLGQERMKAALAFLVLFALVQVVVFTLSSKGAWAEDYTSINRLPLQVYAAVLFAVAMVWKTLAGAAPSIPQWRTLLSRFALAGVLVAIATIAFLQVRTAAGRVATLELDVATWQFPVGGGAVDDGIIEVNRFTDGIALLSSGPVQIDASRLMMLDLHLDYDWSVKWPEEAPAFFWRRKDQSESVSRLTLADSSIFNLAESPEWEGEIIEIGFLVLENQGQVARIDHVSLAGANLATVLEITPTQWFEFEPWTQRSASHLNGGAPEQHLPLNLLVTAWAGVALLLFLFTTGRRNPATRAYGMLLVVLMAWLIVDLRWMANRVRQFQQSWTALHSQSIDERINLYDTGVFHDWLATLVDTQLGPQPRRVLLVPDPKLHEYFGLRSKYELLPHSVAVSSRLPTPAELAGIDYVLFLGDFLPEGADPGLVENVQERYIVLPVAPEIRAMLKPVDFSTRGLLFSVRGRPPGQ